jgi:hypothetical protein
VLRLNWGQQILPATDKESRKRPVIGTVTSWTDGKREDEVAQANANLIAAAPDLLELVKAGLAYGENDYYLDEFWVKRAEAAIARVEGREP